MLTPLLVLVNLFWCVVGDDLHDDDDGTYLLDTLTGVKLAYRTEQKCSDAFWTFVAVLLCIKGALCKLHPARTCI